VSEVSSADLGIQNISLGYYKLDLYVYYWHFYHIHGLESLTKTDGILMTCTGTVSKQLPVYKS
jgi:hypothetical protein